MAQAQAGLRVLFSPDYAARSIAIAGATILNAVNVLIATTILPSVVRDIGGQNLYAWNTTLYVIASIIGAALAPRVLVRLGPRTAFRIAVVAFFLGALVCTVAPTMVVLLLGRTVQGFGGGFLGTLTYAIIRQAYPATLWPRAFALNSAMWGIATVSGPAIGGIFGELGVWRLAFGTVLPISIALGFLFERILRDMGRPEIALTRVPVPQLVLLTASVLAVSAGSIDDSAVSNALGIAVAAILIVWLSRTEGRTANRLLPLGTLNPRAPLGLVFAAMVLLMIGVSADVFTPYFLQLLHGLSPLAAGYMVALMSAGWTVGSVLVSGATGVRAQIVILGGPLLMAGGLAVMAFSVPADANGLLRLSAIGLGLVLLGTGMGSTWPHLLSRALAMAPHHEQALAATSMTTVQLVGSAFGAALGGVITNLTDYSDLAGGGTATAAAWYFGLFCLAPLGAFLLSVVVVRRAGHVPLADPATSH